MSDIQLRGSISSEFHYFKSWQEILNSSGTSTSNTNCGVSLSRHIAEASNQNMKDDPVGLYVVEPIVAKMIESEVLIDTVSLEDCDNVTYNHQEASIENTRQINIGLGLDNNFYQQKIDNSHKAIVTNKSSIELNNINNCNLENSHIVHVDAVLNFKNKIRSRLKEKKNIICDSCKETFDCQSSYYFHRSSHINENGICSWLCAQCNENFSIENDLREHQILVHGEIRPYPCSYCQSSFMHYNSLNDHIHRYHLKEKPHKCTYCVQSFYRPFDLKTHLQIHLGIKKHSCHECGMQFSHPSNLTRHLRIHTGVKPYVCQICSMRFTHFNTHCVHKLSHKMSVTCPYCQVKLQSKLILRKHITHTHNGSGIKKTARVFYCFICGNSFKYKKELKLHEMKHHNDLVKCTICKNKLAPGEEFKNHSCCLKEARGPKTPSSKFCTKTIDADNSIHVKHNKSTDIESLPKPIDYDNDIKVIALDTDEDELTLSIESDHSIVEITITKENSSFDNIENLNSVMLARSETSAMTSKSNVITDQNYNSKSNDIEKLRTLSCEQDNSFSSFFINSEKSNLKKQKKFVPKCDTIEKCVIKSKILKETNFACEHFKCTYCLKIFDKKWNYLQHIGIHDKSLRLFNCDECSLSFSYKASYRAHCQSHTNSDLRYQCSHCPKSYKSKESKYQHEQRVHSKHYKYHCGICKQDLFNKSNYTYHLRLHQKEYPYACFACDKKFAHISNLKRHERVHTGERPHKCLQCPKAFIQAVSLRKHVKKHDNDCLKKNGSNTCVQSSASPLAKAEIIPSISSSSSNYGDTIKVSNASIVNATDPGPSTVDSFNSICVYT